MADAADLHARLEAIRAAFIADLPNRAAELRRLWAELERHGYTAGPVQDFQRHVHSLSGAGATFGCDALSRRAQDLEAEIVALRSGDGAGSLPVLFTALLAAIDAAADPVR